MTHPGYRPDVDGLRAVAVVGVLLFHAFPDSIPGGFIGVDIFFVISGYLISSIIVRSIENGTFSISQFYGRRIRRIFPALLTVVASALLAGWFLLFPDEYKQLGRHTVAGTWFFSNIALWLETGYFDGSAETKPLLHLWSLGVEEQFYILWPLMLWLIYNRKIPSSLAIWIFTLASFALNLAFVRHHREATFFLPYSKVWELSLGALLVRPSKEGDSYLNTYIERLFFSRGITPAVLSRVGAIVLAVILSYFTYRLVERPIRMSRSSVAPWLVMGAIGVALAGQLIFSRDGYEDRFTEESVILKDLRWDDYVLAPGAGVIAELTWTSNRHCKPEFRQQASQCRRGTSVAAKTNRMLFLSGPNIFLSTATRCFSILCTGGVHAFYLEVRLTSRC